MAEPTLIDPTARYAKPPYKKQSQPWPGLAGKMEPQPDHGETSYKGSGRLQGKRAIITGGDSGIGRAVAIAFAREGADILIAYPTEKSHRNHGCRSFESRSGGARQPPLNDPALILRE